MRRTYEKIIVDNFEKYPEFLLHEVVDENGKRYWKAVHLENSKLFQVGNIQTVERFMKKYKHYTRFD